MKSKCKMKKNKIFTLYFIVTYNLSMSDPKPVWKKMK